MLDGDVSVEIPLLKFLKIGGDIHHPFVGDDDRGIDEGAVAAAEILHPPSAFPPQQ